MDRQARRLLEWQDGPAHVYPGTYEDYLWRKQQTTNSAPAAAPAPSPIPATTLSANGHGSDAIAAGTDTKTKRLNPIKRKQMEERSREIEEDIARVEAAIAICATGRLNYVSAEETKRLNLDLEKHREQLAQLMTEWQELSQALGAGYKADHERHGREC